MPTGDLALRKNAIARTETGVMVKVVPSCGPVGSAEVFSTNELRMLDSIIAEAEHASGLRFAAYLGDLGDDTRATAESLLDSFGADAPYTALVAISPGQRVVQIVMGSEATLRVSERGTRAAVLSVAASCGSGDLFGGFTDGIRVLTDHVGGVPK